MKACPNCNSEIEDNFNVCWSCNYSLTDCRVITFNDPKEEGNREIDCLRCKIRLVYAGKHSFHEGTRMGALGNLFELFVNKESFDLYICPKCGKAEFFIPKV